MKSFSFLLLVLLALVGCKQAESSSVSSSEAEARETALNYTDIGAGINAASVGNAEALQQGYDNLKQGDTLEGAYKVKVLEVCQMKGCWMKVDLGNSKTAMVNFKDYGFFVPKDISGQELVIEGKAYQTLMDVEEARHLAEDAGKNEEEINSITEAQPVMKFTASGVRLYDTDEAKDH